MEVLANNIESLYKVDDFIVKRTTTQPSKKEKSKRKETKTDTEQELSEDLYEFQYHQLLTVSDSVMHLSLN